MHTLSYLNANQECFQWLQAPTTKSHRVLRRLHPEFGYARDIAHSLSYVNGRLEPFYLSLI